MKYPGLIYMGYQEKQIDWLANVALQNVPEDYTTVIVGHIHADAMKIAWTKIISSEITITMWT
ncbi:hypothetical protein BIY40_00445 [Pediococcus acidilactici]|nr:hypothetical protein BIY40_00445 [Pediococcus acidilactici]